MSKGFGIESVPKEQQEAQEIAQEFINYLNSFHEKNIQNDKQISRQLFKDYIDIWDNEEKPNFKGVHHFRSSSTGACPREHYMRLKRKKEDPQKVLAQTTRWQNLGTRIGDMIQFDLLLAERYMPRIPNTNCTEFRTKFEFERITKQFQDPFDMMGEDTYESQPFPHFEEFSTTTKHFEHRSKHFCIHGSTDGIMIYTKPDGTTLRVGLEIKSKQGSYSKTSLHSMKWAEYKHRKQTVSYSLMFDVDYWIILYVNASKKSWSPTEEDLVKCPDIRAFGHYVTPAMKNEVLDRFADICAHVDNNIPPELELSNWTFNNYKQECALSLTNEELLDLLDYVESEEVLAFPAWLQVSMKNALEDIAERKGL